MEPSTSNKPGAYGTLKEPAELSVMRVNQLDAGVLDTELHSLLKTQLGRACSGLPAGTLERFKPEVFSTNKGAIGPPKPSHTYPRLLTLGVWSLILAFRCVVVLMLARPSAVRPVNLHLLKSFAASVRLLYRRHTLPTTCAAD